MLTRKLPFIRARAPEPVATFPKEIEVVDSATGEVVGKVSTIRAAEMALNGARAGSPRHYRVTRAA